jgi:NAD(P)-dependent dehydrogenase (short-subunit alcohol dehydrogenase family)
VILPLAGSKRCLPRPPPHGVEQRLNQATQTYVRVSFGSRLPRRKMGRPEEIASVALFLASDDSSYVNGMELVVDGCTTAI